MILFENIAFYRGIYGLNKTTLAAFITRMVLLAICPGCSHHRLTALEHKVAAILRVTELFVRVVPGSGG